MLRLLEIKAADKVNKLKLALSYLDQDLSIWYFHNEIIHLN